MQHCLVLPTELKNKLETAHTITKHHEQWLAIGIDTVDEMIKKIAQTLNENYPKLSVSSIKIEEEEIIKEKVGNVGTSSMFSGYFENQVGKIDALFFYVEPKMESANDFLTRQVMPTILGIYKNIKDNTRDLHINSMPVFIVSLCSTKRIRQDSVKKTIICAETMGFNYCDVFQNQYHDVIKEFDEDGEQIKKIRTLKEFDDLIQQKNVNEYFEVDYSNHKLTVLSTKLENSRNITAELYRYAFRIIPAIYLASKEGYTIDANCLEQFTSSSVEILSQFIQKFGS